jgi:CheY-like chemotaxis protein
LARKILLADDSVTAQNMGRKILTDAGYDVVTVNNGSAALKRVAELKPDLVVLDVYMPGYSGLEVCARLKDSPETSRIPILLTVGKLEPFKPEEATRVRADAFIIKPFEASELLSVLTRLEDRMVPSQAEGSRFGSPVSGIERFSGSGDPAIKKSEGDESDTGWKNRLRFPSKKKKEEPEPEPEPDFVTPQSFREFRRGGGKAPAGSAPFPLSATPAAAQEPGLVPDIPRDITPEELDALSELVAKLDGPAAAAENVAPISEKIGPVDVPAPAVMSEAGAAKASAEVTKEAEGGPNAAEAMKAEVETRLAASPVDTSPVQVAEATPVETAVAQEPAPIDKNDEPTFASATSAAEGTQSADKPEVPASTAASSEPSEPVVEPPVPEPKVEAAAQAEGPKSEEAPKAAEIPQPPPVAAGSHEAASPEGASPSAEELAEALRFLTPSQAPGAPQTLAEAGAALVNELSRGVGAAGRWIAEAVALSPEEASGSLEAEMFRTFATSAGEQAPSNDDASSAGTGKEPGVAVTETAAEIRTESPTFTPAEEHLSAAMVASASASERVEPEQKDSPAEQAHEASEREVAPTTFADAVHRDTVETVAVSAEAVSGPTSSEANGDGSSPENGPGGQEAMGKEEKGKSGKSTWHQLRSGPPAATDAVELAKQAEESPKAMAAAASADSGSDASSIASIVDSVLADLRPKIVEEIAKKLAKK